MSSSRETTRDALVTLLAAALVGTGLPCKTVIGSKPAQLKGKTPLVSMLSGGSLRERMTVSGDKATFYYALHVWVQQSTTGWTNAQAEDALDTIESLIAQTFETNRKSSSWSVLSYESRTTVADVEFEGERYYLERIPVAAKLSKK